MKSFLPTSLVKHRTEGIEDSKPPATLVIVKETVNNAKPNSSHQDKDKAADDTLHIRMLWKEDFKKYGHLKSGRYYIPEQPSLNV